MRKKILTEVSCYAVANNDGSGVLKVDSSAVLSGVWTLTGKDISAIILDLRWSTVRLFFNNLLSYSWLLILISPLELEHDFDNSSPNSLSLSSLFVSSISSFFFWVAEGCC